MLCKITSRNQLTLPKDLVDQLRLGDYLDARIENGCIVLEPMIVRPLVGSRLAAIRQRVAETGTDEDAVPAIVDEVRRAGRL